MMPVYSPPLLFVFSGVIECGMLGVFGGDLEYLYLFFNWRLIVSSNLLVQWWVDFIMFYSNSGQEVELEFGQA